ncbi:hypothetical protein ACQVBX_17295 [Dyella sp. KULCS107]|uniref:hypothetical protein n=1 Tax=Dyella sp. KULCS107 TaxID=3422216 RepID=UPI003D6DCC05
MTRQNLFPLLLLPFVLTACSGEAHGGSNGQADDAQTSSASDTPPIHIQQTLFDLKDGKPVLEQLYRKALTACSKLSVPLKPLDGDTVGKLGRTYVETWYEGDRMAVRQDDWSYDTRQLCLFSPVHHTKLWIVGPDGAQAIDLDRHTGSVDSNIRLERSEAEQTEAPPDDDLKAAVAAQLKQRGQSDLMAQDAGQRREAGQPCRQMRDALIDMCVWTGGTKWGLDTTVSNGPYSLVLSRLQGIVLSAQPADGGDGRYLSTQKMTVGTRFDNGVFNRPSGIAMDKMP